MTNIDGGTKGDLKDFNYYKDYYLNRRYIKNFTTWQIEKINENLSDFVLKAFGYKLILADNPELSLDK